jgi:hypothetical protein
MPRIEYSAAAAIAPAGINFAALCFLSHTFTPLRQVPTAKFNQFLMERSAGTGADFFRIPDGMSDFKRDDMILCVLETTIGMENVLKLASLVQFH